MTYTTTELEQVARRLTEEQKSTLILLAQYAGMPIVVHPSITTAVNGDVIRLNALTRNSLRRLWLIDNGGITEFGSLVAEYLGVSHES